ncbi:hypothetical protein K7X08_000606 [Anisodus acutangulus]|uniref:W2 domain-containing protein n=1 Tax=Anisodus acutangulus TaxID=402998 RepID=A0A9Q1M707_9SOLA|nr:hypothetical protein K7X08_000606 [Anisodus acutangulus]
MALQNIGAGNKDDAFYRYKMPRMITKIEGRENVIKTNVYHRAKILIMVDIAKALSRPASYTTKYFGCELGAQSKFDEKTGTSHILITKSQMLTLKCAACGFISDVDMRDKLTTFILKNPPEQKKGSKNKKATRRAEKERLKEGKAADEEAKKLKKEAAKKKGSSKDGSTKTTKKKANVSDEEHSPTGSQADQTEAPPDSDEEVQWQTDTSMKAAQQRIQEQLNVVTASMVMLSAAEEQKSGKSSPAREGKPKVNGQGTGISVVFSKRRLCTDQWSAVQEDDSQLALLHAIESFCGKSNSEALKEVALVLKALYDIDMLEEEFIVEWYEKGSKGSNKVSPIWKNVKPFVEWLQSAESETEDE